MGSGKRITSILKEYLGKTGIVSLDVGTIGEDANAWEVVENYCEPSVKWLHSLVSEKFILGLKRFDANEPIDYLYDYWKDRADETDIVTYSFSSDGYISNIDNLVQGETNSVFAEYSLDDKLKYDNNTDVLKDRINHILDDITERVDIPQREDPFDSFIMYQEIFTKMVLASFNTILRENGEAEIKYVTIVLLRSFYDGVWHLSYNAAIFSNNISYLKSPVINLLFDYISRGNYLKEIRTLKQYVRNESIKSAKAAIMSRNMSHNLGSHVMAYLKQQMGSVTSIMKEENKVLANLIPDAVKEWDDKKAENVELPFLVGLGRFIGYLQERQDYIATISTDYIPYGAPVNLKDAIYDELNPDLRYLRHKNESSNDTRNKPANILLNYIAKSEGLSRENMKDDFQSEKDIRFGYVAYTKDGGGIFGLNAADDKNTDSFASSNETLTLMRKINFCLPGGLVGRQAVFSIIENLIRNAAKHGDTSRVSNLDFTLDVIDGSEIKKGCVYGWEKRVSDKKWRKLYEEADDIDDLYLLTITDNLSCEDETVTNLKKGLYEDFVDVTTGQMTTANKGIKEIRISAAWIRSDTNEDSYLKYDDSSDNAAGKKAPLVAVEKSDEKHLRYIIGIRKNKIVAIVSEVKDVSGKIVASFDEAVLCKFRELEKQDIDRWSIITDDELKKSKTSYHFILCPDDDKAFRILRPYTSNRLCRWKVNRKSNAVLGRLVSISNNEDTTLNQLLYIYRLFTGLDKKCENVYIDDERAENASKQREREGKSYVHFKKIKFKYNLADINKTKNRIYLYRTHHSTENNYIAFYKSYVEDCKKYKKDLYGCVEGITGDNSSDRLVRREVLDEKWYYTNLYALKKRVAIIDERLFKMIHNVDEKMFVGDSGETIMIEELSQMMDIDEIKEIIIDNSSMEIGMINEIDNAESTEDVVKIIGDRLPRQYFNDVLGKTETDKKVVGVSHLTPYYHGKDVDVFTVVKGAEGKMILVGCTKTRFDAKKKKFSNVFEKLATFKRDEDNEFVLEVVSDKYKKYFMDKYDYISIHQGILDKIYENLGVKNNDEGKCKLTASIHQCMMADKSTYGSYLPRFIIHSGRAKPTKNDMPQEQPFIQYAAIENAVKDCKPMLVELLDFAKYEPSNN